MGTQKPTAETQKLQPRFLCQNVDAQDAGAGLADKIQDLQETCSPLELLGYPSLA